MSNPAFTNDNRAEKAFFEKFMREVTPSPEIHAFATNGSCLVFRSVVGTEFDKIKKKATAFIKMVSTGQGLPPEWKPYQLKDGPELFKLFFLSETMVGWYESSKIIGPDGSEIPDGEDIPEGSKRVPVTGENDSLRLGPWGQKSWLWFRHSSPVSFAGIEAQALGAQALSSDAADTEAVIAAGEGSSATS